MNIPSKPAAPRWVLLLAYLVLLLIAVVAIWWIDRGALMK